MALPANSTDTVFYTTRNLYCDKGVTVVCLDDGYVEFWGNVFVNGSLVVDTALGIPIASQAEALAGTDNTKVMTPLRVREAGDARYALIGAAGLTQEQAEDIVAALFAAGTHTNVTVTYNDATPSLSIAASGGGGITDGDKGEITITGGVWTIDNLAVTAAKIANDTITATQIAADAIGSSELANNAVDTNAIANSAVTNAKLANMNNFTLKGNNTGSAAPATDLIAADVKSLLALNNVTNTSDANKPVSTAQQTALDGKVNDTGNETIAGDKTFSGFTTISDVYIPNTLAVIGASAFSSAVTVPYEIYGAGWNGSNTVPTKDAVYDKIEALIAAGTGVKGIVTHTGTAITASDPSDAGKYLRFTGSNPTYTLPQNSVAAFPVGTQIDGISTTTAMTLIQGTGATVNKARTLVTLGAKSGWTAIKVATDEWDVHGDFV